MMKIKNFSPSGVFFLQKNFLWYNTAGGDANAKKNFKNAHRIRK